MNTGDTYIAEVIKLADNGSGIAKVNGEVVFIKNSCPGDKLKIKIVKANKNYATADIEEIIEPSAKRAIPFCSMQKVCGSCQIQHIDYDYQLELKQQIVQDAMDKIGNINIKIPKTIASPQNKNYRHKIQYPVSQTKNSKRILAGYYKQQSHEIVNIKYCPIQPEICDEIIDFIRNNASFFNIDGYNEKKHNGLLKHVLIRHSTYNHTLLVCLVINSLNITNEIKNFANKIYTSFDKVVGVCINLNNKKTNVILSPKTVCVAGKEFINERICSKTFLIGAGTFFQINPQSAENIFNYIKEFIYNNYNKRPTILDAYAGISAMGICLSDEASNVVCIEDNPKSVELAKKTSELNNINNIEINCGDAAEYFKNEKRIFDIVLLDPPRKGCSEESLNYAFKLCKGHIIYVSCNAATLARDLKILTQKGCTIESIQPFDMFCHTCHVESVAIIKI